MQYGPFSFFQAPLLQQAPALPRLKISLISRHLQPNGVVHDVGKLARVRLLKTKGIGPIS